MFSATVTAKIEERRNDIVNFLTNNPKKEFTVDMIKSGAGFDCGYETIRRDLHFIVANKMLPGFGQFPSTDVNKTSRNNGLCWMYVPAEPEKKEMPDNRYLSPMKNDEGYTDTTAGLAIRNVDKELSSNAISAKTGEIWEAECSNGSSELIFVIKSFPTFTEYVKLMDNLSDKNTKDRKYFRRIQIGGAIYQIDIRRVNTKPNKYISHKVSDCPEYANITADIANVFFDYDIRKKTQSDADMWNALNAREQDLDKREKHLDELANQIAKDRLELADIEEVKKMATAELDKARKQAEQEAADIKAKAEAEADEILQTAYELAASEKKDEPAEETNIQQLMELAILKEKVKLYERLIFGDEDTPGVMNFERRVY